MACVIAVVARKMPVLYLSRPQSDPRQSRSSVVEHLLDMEVVGGSIPLATTNSPDPPRRSHPTADFAEAALSNRPESRMLKFLGSTVGIIFLIGLVVVIVLLKFIF